MRRMIGVSIAALFFPTTAMAEVMDKESSSTSMLLGMVLMAGASVALAKARWWGSLAILPFSGMFAVATMLEIQDPYVGPTIYAEGGWSYLAIAYGFSIVAVILPILAAGFARRTATRDAQGR